MDFSAKGIRKITMGISYLYILLFIYAAVSKLLDFENFRVQLGQSPLLSAFAGWISWLVPALEIMISFLLALHRTRTFALYCSYTLMVMFTAYIYIMLHYSSYTPCSCGGILEKLSWEGHLLFNSGFVVVTAIVLLLLPKMSPTTPVL